MLVKADRDNGGMKMTPDDLKESLGGAAPPAGLAPEVQALWYEAKGDWHRAHGIVQNLDGASAAWVHAYLHRTEGDAGNAGYWYRRAGKPVSNAPHAAEWDEIAAALL